MPSPPRSPGEGPTLVGCGGGQCVGEQLIITLCLALCLAGQGREGGPTWGGTWRGN